MKLGKSSTFFAPTEPAPQKSSWSKPLSLRASPVTIALLKSATHSHTKPCRSQTPHKFGRPSPPAAKTCGAGAEYHFSISRLNSRSSSPSAREGLAPAANSHSATVGKRLLFHCAYAFAANQET